MSAADSPIVTVKGYVLGSAYAFAKGLQKPISKECATSCANAGSQLVILADDGTIYWPIADTTIERPESETFAVCGRQSHGKRQHLQALRLKGHRH